MHYIMRKSKIAFILSGQHFFGVFKSWAVIENNNWQFSYSFHERTKHKKQLEAHESSHVVCLISPQLKLLHAESKINERTSEHSLPSFSKGCLCLCVSHQEVVRVT